MTTTKPTAPGKPADAGRPAAPTKPAGDGIASAAGIGRSTAAKVLAKLASSGRVLRIEGVREGARRLPDGFSLASSEPGAAVAEPPRANAASPKAAGDAGPGRAENDEHAVSAGDQLEAPACEKPKAPEDRLRPGQLDELVIIYLRANASSAPHTPTAVAKALGRSSGAVGNCLVRLAKTKRVRQVTDKPRRYSVAS
jgi:hypothetical protein